MSNETKLYRRCEQALQPNRKLFFVLTIINLVLYLFSLVLSCLSFANYSLANYSHIGVYSLPFISLYKVIEVIVRHTLCCSCNSHRYFCIDLVFRWLFCLHNLFYFTLFVRFAFESKSNDTSKPEPLTTVDEVWLGFISINGFIENMLFLSRRCYHVTAPSNEDYLLADLTQQVTG